MELKHAVVALDLSDSSNSIVRCLPELKNLGLEQVTLLTVVSNPYPGGPEKFDKSSLQDKLNHFNSMLDAEGISARTDLRIASNTYAPISILNAAYEHEADWLILGNRGHNRFSELFLGSVASEIIQRSGIPVLLLRISDKPDSGNQSACGPVLEHVLLPTDFSVYADNAISLFEGNPRPEKVTLLHVAPGKGHEIGDELTERVERLQIKDHPVVEEEFVHGKPFLKILEYCDQHQPSLVVMGAQGKGHMADLFIGSHSLRVARYIKQPLLLIPADQG